MSQSGPLLGYMWLKVSLPKAEWGILVVKQNTK